MGVVSMYMGGDFFSISPLFGEVSAMPYQCVDESFTATKTKLNKQEFMIHKPAQFFLSVNPSDSWLCGGRVWSIITDHGYCCAVIVPLGA